MNWSIQQLLISSENGSINDPLIPPIASVVGREQELAFLRKRLCGAEISDPIISLSGIPGVGKTALAVALAYDPQIRTEFPAGILWAGLGPRPDIIGQLTRWATLCGLSSTEMSVLSIDAKKEAIRNIIGDRRMLLIIDDIWQIEDALAFNVGGPSCIHLMTTRFINIATWFTPGDPVLLRELSEERSLDLLHLLAPQVVEHEATKARTLVQAVGGLPLALTLTGNYLRLHAYSGQSRRIQAALERLTYAETRLHLSETQGPAERHPGFSTEQPLSLHAIIAVSDQHLSNEARSALYALSVLPHKPDTFSEKAALATCCCSPDILDTLIDTGLLESAGDGRYTLHQTIADYAHTHLQGTESHNHLIHHAIVFLNTHQTEYELLDLESGTILAALEAANSIGNQTDLISCVCAFTPFLLLRGNYTVAEQQLHRAYQAALALNDQHGIIHTLFHLGELAGRQGDYTRSQEILQQGIDLARPLGDSERISALLTSLGHALWKLGKYRQANEVLQEGLVLARNQENIERTCQVLATLGAVVEQQGNYTLSETYYREGLVLAQQSGNQEQTCRLLMDLGTTLAIQGKLTQSETILRESLLIARQIGHQENMCNALANLGHLVRAVYKDYAQAEAYLQEGLALARKIGQREWTCAMLVNLAEIAIDLCHYQQAQRYLEESAAEAIKLGIVRLSTITAFYRGIVALQEQIEEAKTIFDEMENMFPKDDVELYALLQYGQARLAAAQGNVLKARQLGEASAHTYKKLGHHQFHEVSQWLSSLA